VAERPPLPLDQGGCRAAGSGEPDSSFDERGSSVRERGASFDERGSSVRTRGSSFDAGDRRDEAPSTLPAEPVCPFCEGGETEIMNAFGSHASVSTYWCRACGSPFELMKWR